MNVAKLLEQRRPQWDELDALCERMQWSGRPSKKQSRWKRNRKTSPSASANNTELAAASDAPPPLPPTEQVARFATLYRSVCADLALADAYQLPPATVSYLHRLVARAHNQLYRSEKFIPSSWAVTLFHDAPRKIFQDTCVRIAAVVFFGLFALAMLMARDEQRFGQFAETVVGSEELANVEEMYDKPIQGSLDHYVTMAAFYIKHNTGIGLVCFGLGVLILPCLFKLAFNAVLLGSIFGYMARDSSNGGDHFFHFVTAHGPFELTAIVLSAAAGLKLGVGLFWTGGLRRTDSLRIAALDALPIIAASAALFVLAAMTEGFISPSSLPYLIKCFWAILSSGMISFYFVVLGFPREEFSRLLSPAGHSD